MTHIYLQLLVLSTKLFAGIKTKTKTETKRKTS